MTCKVIFPLNKKYFYHNRNQSGGFQYECKKCHYISNKKCPSFQNKEEEYQKMRRKILEFYSAIPPKCSKCGCDIYEVLELDHINNDGAKERKWRKNSTSFYYWIKKNNFPDKYQVLCKNCSWLKFYNYKKNRD